MAKPLTLNLSCRENDRISVSSGPGAGGYYRLPIFPPLPCTFILPRFSHLIFDVIFARWGAREPGRPQPPFPVLTLTRSSAAFELENKIMMDTTGSAKGSKRRPILPDGGCGMTKAG